MTTFTAVEDISNEGNQLSFPVSSGENTLGVFNTDEAIAITLHDNEINSYVPDEFLIKKNIKAFIKPSLALYRGLIQFTILSRPWFGKHYYITEEFLTLASDKQFIDICCELACKNPVLALFFEKLTVEIRFFLMLGGATAANIKQCSKQKNDEIYEMQRNAVDNATGGHMQSMQEMPDEEKQSKIVASPNPNPVNLNF